MRVLVCGGRDYNDWNRVVNVLSEYFPWELPEGDYLIIEGGALGADALARQFAEDYGIPFREFKADWNSFGRAAGPIRNTQMLVEGKPDLVIAFPGGRGTANMVAQARHADVEVIEVV